MKCDKCNAPLSGSVSGGFMGTAAGTGAAENVNLKKTVSEHQAFGSVNAAAENAGQSDSSNCRKCGYPIGYGMSSCPNCGTDINGSRDLHTGQKPSHSGTVNPWATPQAAGASCKLRPLAWENEPEPRRELCFSGTNISLNRANTDPYNTTITSQQQAELTFEGGAWYICDKSAQQTTYVHAGRKTKLEKGDIIILGNRRFEFND